MQPAVAQFTGREASKRFSRTQARRRGRLPAGHLRALPPVPLASSPASSGGVSPPVPVAGTRTPRHSQPRTAAVLEAAAVRGCAPFNTNASARRPGARRLRRRDVRMKQKGPGNPKLDLPSGPLRRECRAPGGRSAVLRSGASPPPQPRPATTPPGACPRCRRPPRYPTLQLRLLDRVLPLALALCARRHVRLRPVPGHE